MAQVRECRARSTALQALYCEPKRKVLDLTTKGDERSAKQNLNSNDSLRNNSCASISSLFVKVIDARKKRGKAKLRNKCAT